MLLKNVGAASWGFGGMTTGNGQVLFKSGDPYGSFDAVDLNTNYFYYSDSWQRIEQRRDNRSTIAQHVWSPVYVDALIERDYNTNMDGSLMSGRMRCRMRTGT